MWTPWTRTPEQSPSGNSNEFSPGAAHRGIVLFRMEKMEYTIIRSSRKTISIQLSPSGEVVVRAPNRMPKRDIERFLEEKRDWIEGHLRKLPQVPPKLTEEELEELARNAKEILPEITAHFAPLVGVVYGRITIRAQRTRWGSCSVQGNLNFNCLLMLAPDDVMEYVVVHELCHRKEMNHSARFWAEVERVLPGYRESRRWLKEHGGGLICRL